MIITGQVEPLGEVVFWSCDKSVHPQTLLKFWGGSLWSWLSGRNLLSFITIHFSSLSKLVLYLHINRGTANDHCGIAEHPRWSVVQKLWTASLPSEPIEILKKLFLNLTFRKKLLWLHPNCLGSLSKLGLYLHIKTGTITDHHGIARYGKHHEQAILRIAESLGWCFQQKLWHVGLPWDQIDFWDGTVDTQLSGGKPTFASCYLA